MPVLEGVGESHVELINTKIQVYQACLLSTLLHGSVTWALNACQEHRLNMFHLWRILGIINHGKTASLKGMPLEWAGIPSIYALLTLPFSDDQACSLHGRWSNPQGHAVRRTDH